jgi:hypothetical protein
MWWDRGNSEKYVAVDETWYNSFHAYWAIIPAIT